VTFTGLTGPLARDPADGALLVKDPRVNQPSGVAGLDVNGKVPWALLAGSVVNVKDAAYGAKGDSNATASTGTDDTAAVQAAFAAVPNGGTVFIPRGTYKLTAAITSDLDDVAIVGERGTKLVLAAGSNSNVFRFNTTADTATNGTIRKNRVLLRDLYIDHQGASQGNTGGIDGCVAAPSINFFTAENVYVKNSKNAAFEVRGSDVVRFTNCTVDGVLFGNNGNGFNVGKTGKIAGGDVQFTGCTVIGCQDVAFWVGGDGAHRLTAQGCVVRGDASKILTDGAITSGQATFTSASAVFTKQDEGKTITVNGAGPAGAALTTRIATFTNATTVVLGSNASTTVVGRDVLIRVRQRPCTQGRGRQHHLRPGDAHVRHGGVHRE
jgi:hypothetical protein